MLVKFPLSPTCPRRQVQARPCIAGRPVRTPWRNGSASDSRSEGCVFKSRRGQVTRSIFVPVRPCRCVSARCCRCFSSASSSFSFFIFFIRSSGHVRAACPTACGDQIHNERGDIGHLLENILKVGVDKTRLRVSRSARQCPVAAPASGTCEGAATPGSCAHWITGLPIRIPNQ